MTNPQAQFINNPEAPRDIAVIRPEVIKRRPDFLAANRGKRFVTPSFVLLAHKRREDHPVAPDTVRYGITVPKKSATRSPAIA